MQLIIFITALRLPRLQYLRGTQHMVKIRRHKSVERKPGLILCNAERPNGNYVQRRRNV